MIDSGEVAQDNENCGVLVNIYQQRILNEGGI